MNTFTTARELIRQFKGDHYLFGPDALADCGQFLAQAGRKATLVIRAYRGSQAHIATIQDALNANKIDICGVIAGAAPNAPRADLFRIASELSQLDYDVLISFGGGSNIDATKAADVIVRLGGEIDDYFGTGLVSRRIHDSGKRLTPHIAIQTVASSAAHLTKYSNITDIARGQKNLIVDEAIVPPYALFDYTITQTTPPVITMDGALDSIAHSLEVLYGAVNTPDYKRLEQIAITGISLVVDHLPTALKDPANTTAREALCLGADLGGYAIMLGGTNGGHLTSFSLVDILSHGRACAMLNPYYTVFFAPAIERPLRVIGQIYRKGGYATADFDNLTGRDLGIAVAEAMFEFAQTIGFPTYLQQVEGFSTEHIQRALTAAKSPQLKMKLENMPISLSAAMIDDYMAPILQAAATGDLRVIRNVE
jgi:alcohol dehydrogenase